MASAEGIKGTSEHDSASLDKSLIHGLAWTGTAKWVTQLVRWVATFAIARLLTPGDYGLVGIAMVYVGLVQLTNEFGLSSAIVQNRDLTNRQIEELGTLAVGFALLLVLVSSVSAVPIALFFDEPQVTWIIIALSSKFVIDSVAMVPRARLARDLHFRRLAWLEGAEALSMAFVTLAVAFLLRSYWALVAGILVSSVVGAAIALFSRPWRPRWPRELTVLRRAVNFGGNVVGSTLAWYAYSNADFVIVGRLLDKAALGAYSLAWNVASVPVEKVSVMVSRVSPAVFAAVQHDLPALRRYYVGLIEGLALITFPMAVGLALVAPDLVPAVLGDQWTAAIAPLRILAVFAGARSLAALPQIVLVARGHAREARNFSIVAAVVLPISFLIGSRWGMTGIATAWLIGLPLCVIPLDFRYSMKLVGLSARPVVSALGPAVAGCAVMAISVLLVKQALPADAGHVVALLVSSLTGAAAYTGYILVAHRDRVRAFRATFRGARRAADVSSSHVAAQPAATPPIAAGVSTCAE